MNSKKVTLRLRIFLIILSALMVLGIAYTTIAMIVGSIQEKKAAEQEQTEQTDEHDDHEGHDHD